MQYGCFHWKTFVFMVVFMPRVVVTWMIVMMGVICMYFLNTFSVISNLLIWFWMIVATFFTILMDMLMLAFALFLTVLMVMLVIMLVIMFMIVFMCMFVLTFVIMRTVFVLMLFFFFSIIDGRFSFDFSSLNNHLNLMLMYLLNLSLFFMTMLLVFLINQTLNVFANQLWTDVLSLRLIINRVLLSTRFSHQTMRMGTPSMEDKIHYNVDW